MLKKLIELPFSPKRFHVQLMLLTLSFIAPSHAYDLGEPNCGGEYGGLAIKFSPKIKKFKEVQDRLSSKKWANYNYTVMYPDYYSPRRRTSSILREIREVWSRDENAGSEIGDFQVPVGSEKFIGEQLERLGIAQKVTHAVGACGGAEVSYALVKKAFSGNTTDSLTFSEFAKKAVKYYAKETELESTIDEGPLKISPIEPHYATKRFTLAVPSELSRGKQAGQSWDKFDLVLSLLGTKGDDYIVVAHAENLKVARRRDGRNRPPTNEFFKALKVEESLANYQSEYIAAAGFVRFLGGSASRCKAEAEGFFSYDEGPFRCQMEFSYR